MATLTRAFTTRETFRFARVGPPRVVDLQLRARRHPELRALLDAPAEERAEWAASVHQSEGFVRGPDDLRFDYLSHLALDAIPTRSLPTRANLKNAADFAARAIHEDADYRADTRSCCTLP